MHIFILSVCNVVNVCSSAPGRSYALYDVLTNYKIELNFTFGIITLLCLSYLHLCNRVKYVCFSHNLSILAKSKPYK